MLFMYLKRSLKSKLNNLYTIIVVIPNINCSINSTAKEVEKLFNSING